MSLVPYPDTIVSGIWTTVKVVTAVRRAREDAEIEAIMRENGDLDAALAAEFESTLTDGL